jgi:kynurenine formamidase
MPTTRRRFLLGAAAIGGAAMGRPGVAAQRSDTALPTREEVEAVYIEGRNWGRWGPDDQVGAVNLITPHKRTQAAALARTGRTVSLSRAYEPEQQFIRRNVRGRGGSAIDYYGSIYDGMWQGRDPDVEIDTQGLRFGDITAWREGIITKGVLLDVPRHRGEPHVTAERPVHGWELEAIADAQAVSVDAGDALLVYSGREEYHRRGHGFERHLLAEGGAWPGLHPSCAKFIRDRDVALLGWDMMDARPDGYGLTWPVHGVLFNYGVALLDNALLEPLANACAAEARYEFMFMALPLNVPRGTGSPVNPVAMF